jgi:5-oxoprolinase (ATP-hydrolysing) subunit A
MSASTPNPRRMDLNADLGEGITDDTGLLAVVTSANVACGFHAGDRDVMRAVCDVAAARGVVVGAQVSYLDRQGFGRRPMEVAAAVLSEWVAEQVATLSSVAAASGVEVAYVKPHGALYNRVVDDEEQALAVLSEWVAEQVATLSSVAAASGVEVAYVKPHGALYNRVVDDEEQALAVLAGSLELPVLGLPGSALLRLAGKTGRLAVPEGFPDRGYTPDGRLVPRTEPGALVRDVDLVAQNAVSLAGSGAVRTVCVHGDSPGALRAAHAVRHALVEGGWTVRSWAQQ